MGEAADRTLREIAAARAALELDIDELQQRMPPGSVLAKGAAVAGGGGAALTAVLGIVKKILERRSQEKAVAKDAAVQARAIAAAFAAMQSERDVNPTAEAKDAAREAIHDQEGGSKGLVVLLVAIVGAVAMVVVRQRKQSEDEGLWQDEPTPRTLTGRDADLRDDLEPGITG